MLTLLFLLPAILLAQESNTRGRYFYKKEYLPAELPRFAHSRHLLPSPVWDENPQWVELYWKAWEIAFKNLYQPKENTGFITNYIDAAFNGCIFMWDSAFMLMFGKYAD